MANRLEGRPPTLRKSTSKATTAADSDDDSKLLLAATAVASQARTLAGEAASDIARIDGIVLARLEDSLQEDASVWELLHNQSWQTADELWEQVCNDAVSHTYILKDTTIKN